MTKISNFKSYSVSRADTHSILSSSTGLRAVYSLMDWLGSILFDESTLIYGEESGWSEVQKEPAAGISEK